MEWRAGRNGWRRVVVGEARRQCYRQGAARRSADALRRRPIASQSDRRGNWRDGDVGEDQAYKGEEGASWMNYG